MVERIEKTQPDHRPIWLAVVLCGSILFFVPAVIVFLSGLAAIPVALVCLLLLIGAQYFVLWPVWRKLLRKRRELIGEGAGEVFPDDA